ncbi:Exoskeleton protein RP43, partial [Lamellibrachia satsuma]
MILSACSQRVRLHFYRFNLEFGGPPCPYDWVKIYDGSDATAPLIGTYCGTTVPGDIVSTGRAVFVSFASDYSVIRSGFRIRYSIVSCSQPKVLNTPVAYFGTVGSPYGDFEDCSWKVQVPGNKRLRVHLISFNLENVHDKLKINNAVYSGPNKPADVVTSGNTAIVSFTSDYSVTNPGFWIRTSLGETNN